jgi:hypothetical protein
VPLRSRSISISMSPDDSVSKVWERFPFLELPPITTNRLVLFVAEVLGHLLVQRSLHHGLDHGLKQPV